MMNDRYSRQTLFSQIGEQGQQRIADKHVLIIGAGALGTGNAESLVRAGVGKLTIVDRDYVELSNLQRQQLYVEVDAENLVPKAFAAKKRLHEINSEVMIESHILDVVPQEFERLIAGVDLILDATDNFDIRMMINDMSQKYEIPWIYGSCVGSYGISFTIIPKETPCLHCLMENVPLNGLTCDTAGIINPTVGLVVAHQTAEALKILVEDWDALRKKIITFDLWTNQHSTVAVSKMKKENCLSCGENPIYPFLRFENQIQTAVLCGRDTVQIRHPHKEKRDLEKIFASLSAKGHDVQLNSFLLFLAINEQQRLVMFQDGRALVHGTNDVIEAKKLYHRYFG
jgi:molybdopterin/thiamine biosynthesis adenylyltransferase